MHTVDPSSVHPNGASNGHAAEEPVEPAGDNAAQLDLTFAARGVATVYDDEVAGTPIEEGIVMPETIRKRDGREVSFDPGRIEAALNRCFAALGRAPYTPVAELAVRVVNIMAARQARRPDAPPTVEEVQDAVELTLQAAGEFEAAKAYILYRAEHAKQREERPIPPEVRDAFAEADQYFPSPLQKFQYFDKYSRFDYDQGRRETWIETVDRSVGFLHELVQTNTGVDLGGDTYDRIRRCILEMKGRPCRPCAWSPWPARSAPRSRRHYRVITNVTDPTQRAESHNIWVAIRSDSPYVVHRAG